MSKSRKRRCRPTRSLPRRLSRVVADPSRFSDGGRMVTMDEDQAIAHVQDRLIERYPDVGPDVVRDAVQDVHHHFDGRVRNYVPILVEREAAGRLAELSTRAEGEQSET